MQEIIIKKISTPPKPDLEKDMLWVCDSFGFCGSRDRDKTASKIFSTVLVGSNNKNGFKSDELASICHLTRGAIIHHINNFISSGLMVKEDGVYMMRSKSLRKTIDELEMDTLRIFSEMKKIANDIDNVLGIESR